MFDPAVLGTLLIGLDSVRQSEHHDGSPQPARARRRPSMLAASRGTVARRRFAADRRRPHVEVDGSLVGS
jgi:hypothetical protein